MTSTDFIQGSVWITTGRLVAVAGRFVAGLLMTRILGPEGCGQAQPPVLRKELDQVIFDRVKGLVHVEVLRAL